LLLEDYVCAFLYPTLDVSVTPIEILIRSDPGPIWTPHIDLQVPFHVSPNERLFVVTFWASDGINTPSFVLFLPFSTLLLHLDTVIPGTNSHMFEWEDWGPEGTRLMPSMGHSDIWVCYVFGMRFVAPHSATMGVSGQHSAIDVYDFNGLALRRIISGAQQPVYGTEVIIEPTVISVVNHGIFAEDISTSLPYRIRTLSLPPKDGEAHKFTAAMCSEDSLITVGVSIFSLLLSHIHS
jgi:hypothetical protein